MQRTRYTPSSRHLHEHKKEDVLKLPGQIYEDIELTPPPSLLKQYKQFEREKVMECIDSNGEIVAGTEAALTNKLLQFANGAIYDVESQVHRIHDIKLDALEEMLEEAGGDPVLVLYAYKHDAERIRAHPMPEPLTNPGGYRRMEPRRDTGSASAPGKHRPRAQPSGRRTPADMVRPSVELGVISASQRATKPTRTEERLQDIST